MDRWQLTLYSRLRDAVLAKGTMEKFMDYGKLASTFVNVRTGKAVRIVALDNSRDKAKDLFPHLEDKYAAQLEGQ